MADEISYVAFSQSELEAIGAALDDAVFQLRHTKHCICPTCRALQKVNIWAGRKEEAPKTLKT